MKPSHTQEQSLLQAALQLESGPPRDAFLDAACAGNADLRRRLDELLAAYSEGDAFFRDDPLKQVGLEKATELHVSPAPPLIEGPGTQIGRYKLLQQIGEGGFGVVYMAEQKEPVKRRVALKIIKLGMETKQVVARFEAERQALAMMDHPNIAKVLDGGATDSGRPYFVMELVKGVPITQFSDENSLSTKERLELFATVCHAIQHAHQKGIIHRDVKPTNILVTLHDGKPVPKVIDFGIAKATQQELTEKTIFTQFQQMIGTPAYMSPEQAEMSGLDIDTRTDIYALGVLLYELLTGKTPLDAKILLSGGYDEIRRRIKEEEPPRPSTRVSTMEGDELTTNAKHRNVDPKRFAAELRGDLDWIVMKALEKDRTRRYDSATGFAQDIQRFLENEPVVARPPSAAYRLQKFVRRNRLAFAAATGVVTALLLGTVVSAWQAVRAGREAARAQAAQSVANENATIAETEKQRADSQRRQAVETARVLRQNLYVSDMGKAYQAARDGEVGRAKQLIDRHRPKPREEGEEDLRGFEWRYLWALCWPNEQSTFPAPDQPLDKAVFSPDGKMMAGWETNVVVFDVASRRLLQRFERFEDMPEVSRRLIFSYDGRFLAAKGGHEIRVWRTADWHQVFSSTNAEINPNSGNGLVISLDSATVAAPTHGGVGFWNVTTGQKIPAPDGSWPTLPGDWFLGMCMAYSPDGAFLAVSHYTTNQIRNARTLTIITNLVHPGRETTAFRTLSMAFSTNLMAAGSREGELRLWETKSWTEVARIKAHATYLTALEFSPDGRYLASGGQQEQEVYLWDVAELVGRQFDSAIPRPLATLKGHTNSISSVHFSPDGHTLAATSRDQITKFWTIPSKTEASVTLDHSTQILWISPDGQRLISVNDDNRVYAWETFDVLQSRLLKIPTDLFEYGPRAVSPDGKTLAIGQADGTTEVWHLNTGRRAQLIPPIRPHRPAENSERQLEFSPDGRFLVCCQENAGIVIKALAGGKDIVLTNLAGPIAISPDGRVLAAPQRIGDRIELWSMAENRSQATLQISIATDWAATSGALCFSPDGRLLVVTSVRTDSIQVWNLKTRNRQKVLPLLKPAVESMVFSPDGKTLVMRSLENVVAFWNVATWEEMFREFHYCPDGGGAVRFSADGSALTFPERLSMDGQRPYVLWRAPSLAEIDAAERARAEDTSSASREDSK